MFVKVGGWLRCVDIVLAGAVRQLVWLTHRVSPLPLACSPTHTTHAQLSAAGDAELAHIRSIIAPSFSKQVMSVDDAGGRCVPCVP